MVFGVSLKKKGEATKPPFAATPLLESAGFAAISTVFWARDLDERVSQRVKKLLSRGLAAFYSIGTAIDPLWEQRWGSEAHLQIHFWTGAPFPLPNRPDHEVHATAHSPAPVVTAWNDAFEPSMVTHPRALELEPTLKSISTPRSSTPLSAAPLSAGFQPLSTFPALSTSLRGPCFAEAEDLPAIADVLPARSPPSGPRPAAAAAAAEKLLPRSVRTVNQNQSTRRRLRQRLIFQKWMRRRSKSGTSLDKPEKPEKPEKPKTPETPDASRELELSKSDECASSGLDIDALIAQHVLNEAAPMRGPRTNIEANASRTSVASIANFSSVAADVSAADAITAALVADDAEASPDDVREIRGSAAEPAEPSMASVAARVSPPTGKPPIGKRERLRRVFKHAPRDLLST